MSNNNKSAKSAKSVTPEVVTAPVAAVVVTPPEPKASKAKVAKVAPDAAAIEASAVAIDTALQTVVETAIIAAANLTQAVKDAVSKYKELGLQDDAICNRIKAIYERANKSNSVNKALRSAGLRQRALRSDAGKARDAVSILDALMESAKKAKAKAKGEKEEVDAIERLAKRAWAFADEDADDAIEMLKAAIAMIEAGDMDDTDESAE